jgi:hypothetical protein
MFLFLIILFVYLRDYIQSFFKRPAIYVQTIKTSNKPSIKFEDKYLDKFKKMPNDFYFSQDDNNEIEQQFQNLCKHFEQHKIEGINFLLKKIQTAQNIIDLDINNPLTKDELIKYFDIDEDDDELNEDWQNEYFLLLKDEIVQMLEELESVKIQKLDCEAMLKQAKEYVITKKLNNLIHCFVSEYTPIGDIYMRYNHDKESFEYFSNHNIPYRYLEPVARKYAITFWCKPIVYDINEEIKEIDRKELPENNIKKTHNLTKQPLKNRNIPVLPVLKKSENMLESNSSKVKVKENANRYTWEGRIADFNPLQKIDKKITNKKLSLTYAEFKRLKNKKM